jgi:N-acyl homoserine lactone hydrolase
MELVPLYLGFPARSHRGYLGLSSAYLVVGERLILYDTLGYGEREGLFARMEALGFSPLDVEVVILSHLHFDHAANADLFPWAEVWVHEMELVHAARVREDPRRDLACLAYLPRRFPTCGLWWRGGGPRDVPPPPARAHPWPRGALARGDWGPV